MSGTRQIQAALEDHADAIITKVGRSRTSISRWIATVTAAAVISTITLASGAVISGQALAQSSQLSKPYPGGMMAPLQKIPIPSLTEGDYHPKPVKEATKQPTVDVPTIKAAFLDTAVDAIRYNSGMSYEEAMEVIHEMVDAAEFAIEQRKAPGRLVFSSHGVTLNYNDPANPVLTAYYGARSLDGRPNLVGKHGAVQRGHQVEIFNGDEHYIVPKAP